MKKTILISIAVVILGILGWGAFLFFTAATARPCGGGPRGRCMSNLSQFGKAMAMYEIDHSNQWPTAFGELVPTYLEHPRVFRCPEAGGVVGSITNVDTWTRYVLIPLSPDCPADRAHAFCPPENHGGDGANVLFADGSVGWFTAKDFEVLVQEQGFTEIRRKHQQRPERD